MQIVFCFWKQQHNILNVFQKGFSLGSSFMRKGGQDQRRRSWPAKGHDQRKKAMTSEKWATTSKREPWPAKGGHDQGRGGRWSVKGGHDQRKGAMTSERGPWRAKGGHDQRKGYDQRKGHDQRKAGHDQRKAGPDERKWAMTNERDAMTSERAAWLAKGGNDQRKPKGTPVVTQQSNFKTQDGFQWIVAQKVILNTYNTWIQLSRPMPGSEA
jgi:hypothetical protein